MLMYSYSLYYLIRLMRSQWLIPSEIEEIQRKKLRALVRHAYEKVDYYRELFDSARVKPEEINDLHDLTRIPITTKRQLQAVPIEKVTARGIQLDECMKVRTSGSTGIPLDILIGPKDLRFRGAVIMRAFFANAYRLTDRVVSLADFPLKRSSHWYQSLGIRRHKNIPAFLGIEEQIKELQGENPDLLIINPSRFEVIEEKLRETDPHAIRPRIVMTGGNVLARESRRRMEAIFGVPVIDLYSSWEFGNIAWECSHRAGYHMNTDSLVIELIHEGRRVSPGERGELIITGLDAYAMPFIRYQIGDIGLLSDHGCPCGRGLPLLERIEGRNNDLIRLADGRVVSSYPITNLLRSIPGILQFRFVQEGLREFKVDLVTGKGFGRETIEKAEKGLGEILGPDIILQFRMVNEIPPDPSGKIRSVLSRVE